MLQGSDNFAGSDIFTGGAISKYVHRKQRCRGGRVQRRCRGGGMRRGWWWALNCYALINNPGSELFCIN